MATETKRRDYQDEEASFNALVARFGLGTQPGRREDLFRRIAAAIARWGEPCYRLVAGVAGESRGARQPDRYFCAAVVRRLRERGFFDGEEVEL